MMRPRSPRWSISCTTGVCNSLSYTNCRKPSNLLFEFSMKLIEIIPKGRAVIVTPEQLEQIAPHGWFSYSRCRLTRSHEAAIAHLNRFRRSYRISH